MSTSHTEAMDLNLEPDVQGGAFGTGAAVPDALVSDFAAGMLRQQGENYFQRGQAFVQSKWGSCRPLTCSITSTSTVAMVSQSLVAKLLL